MISNDEERSMKWYNFFVKYLLPVWIVFGAITLFIFAYTNLTLFVIESILLVILFVAYKELKLKTYKGYTYILAYLVFRLVYPLILILTGNGSIQQLTSMLITYSIICIPNIIYFYKRKSLFTLYHMQ